MDKAKRQFKEVWRYLQEKWINPKSIVVAWRLLLWASVLWVITLWVTIIEWIKNKPRNSNEYTSQNQEDVWSVEIIEELEVPNPELECNFDDHIWSDVDDILDTEANKFWKLGKWTLKEFLDNHWITLDEIVDNWWITKLWELYYYIKWVGRIQFNKAETIKILLKIKKLWILSDDLKADAYKKSFKKTIEIFDEFLNKHKKYFENRVNEVWSDKENIELFITDELRYSIDMCIKEASFWKTNEEFSELKDSSKGDDLKKYHNEYLQQKNSFIKRIWEYIFEKFKPKFSKKEVLDIINKK